MHQVPTLLAKLYLDSLSGAELWIVGSGSLVHQVHLLISTKPRRAMGIIRTYEVDRSQEAPVSSESEVRWYFSDLGSLV